MVANGCQHPHKQHTLAPQCGLYPLSLLPHLVKVTILTKISKFQSANNDGDSDCSSIKMSETARRYCEL